MNTLEEMMADDRDHTCYRCNKNLPEGKVLPSGQRYDQYDGCSAVSIFGGYGMFHDAMDLNCEIETILCHDCTLELFRFLRFDPRTMSDMRGLHPYMDENGKPQETPCCEFGWGPINDKDGKWVGVTCGYDPETVHLHKEQS